MQNTLRVVGEVAPSPVSRAQASARTVANRVASEATQAARQRLAMISGRWSLLTDEQRRSFVALGQRYPLNPKKSTTTGKNLYVHLNTYRDLAGQELLDVAPTVPEKVATLPDFTLTSTNSNGAFVLRAVPSLAFSGRVLITGLRPQTAGTVLMDTTRYVVLEVSDNWPVSGVSLAASFSQVFGVPDAGTRVGVCITAMSPLGFLGVPRYKDVMVTVPSGELAVTE